MTIARHAGDGADQIGRIEPRRLSDAAAAGQANHGLAIGDQRCATGASIIDAADASALRLQVDFHPKILAGILGAGGRSRRAPVSASQRGVKQVAHALRRALAAAHSLNDIAFAIKEQPPTRPGPAARVDQRPNPVRLARLEIVVSSSKAVLRSRVHVRSRLAPDSPKGRHSPGLRDPRPSPVSARNPRARSRGGRRTGHRHRVSERQVAPRGGMVNAGGAAGRSGPLREGG